MQPGRELVPYRPMHPVKSIDQIALMRMYERIGNETIQPKPWWQTAFHYVFREILGL